jgi:hypothetical protein
VRFPCLAWTATLACLLLAAPAFAQEEGVSIDPDSPSAKEYTIPLESERRQADPGQEASAAIVQGARTAPLFGAGIGSAGDAGGARPDSSASEPRASSQAGDGPRRDAPQAGDPEVLRAATSNPGPPAGGIGVALTIGGAAVAVLLIGGLAGLLWRRRA